MIGRYGGLFGSGFEVFDSFDHSELGEFDEAFAGGLQEAAHSGDAVDRVESVVGSASIDQS